MLVIIGLIVGVVVTAQSMIASATIQRGISQLNQYRTAITVFRDKYGGLPGDLPNLKAQRYGFTPQVGGYPSRTGDRLISNNGNIWPGSCGEPTIFWNDLSTAGLIEGQFTGQDSFYNSANCNTTTPDLFYPKSKLRNDASVIVFADPMEARNYFMIIGLTSVSVYGAYANAAGNLKGLSPFEAYSIDAKIDDGTPLGGQITARLSSTYNSVGNPSPLDTPAAPNSGVCVSNVTGNPYNTTTSTYSNAVSCMLRIPML